MLLCAAQRVPARQETAGTISFGGYEWEIRQAGKGGPGPNVWNPQNVWVDKAGLHLKISRVHNGEKTEWQCAELSTTQALGMGTYQFQVTGPIDRLDRYVVLGLFDYPPSLAVGPDGTNEIDIEFAHWGRADTPIGNYTIYPASGKRGQNDSHTFSFTLKGDDTTQRFVRSADNVSLQSLQGHRNDNRNEIASWVYAPLDKRLIPQKPLPVHINLWLFQGKSPDDGKEITVTIKKFTFTPAP
ncbi:MAG: hypothetical protein JWL77_2968 [Chthonomonadaceae bacterium]|nr:hypothetical protein [Chthonomonadaceae bacterium]